MKKLMRSLLPIAMILLTAFSCTQHRTLRGPASVDLNYLSPNLEKSTSQVKILVETKGLPLSACHHEFRNTFASLKNLPKNYFQYGEKEGQKILKTLSNIDKGIQSQVKKWSENQVMDKECANSARAAMQATRLIKMELQSSLKS